MKYIFTLFHKSYGFFGRTYRSAFIPLRKARDTYDTNIPQYIYFYSSIPFSDILIVIEFVVRPKDLFSTEKLEPISAGWVSSEITAIPKKGMYIDILEGTPRLLLIANYRKVHKRSGRIEYETMSLGGDKNIRRLIPENCICGPNDEIGGLKLKRLPNEINTLLQSSVESGELELFSTEEIYINSCIIKVPLNLNGMIVEAFKSLYNEEVSVYEYRLRAASHNSWQCVNKAKLRNSITLTQDGNYLKSNGILSLDGVFTTPTIAILFQLECTLELSSENQQKELISLPLGELVALPNIHIDTMQFLPSIINEPFVLQSIIPENIIWTFNSKPKPEDNLILICEISPYQGSAEENDILTLVKATEERNKVEEAHNQWLKELNRKETLRNKELLKEERELELKAKKLLMYTTKEKAKKPVQTEMAKASSRFPGTESQKIKEEMKEQDEGMGREIPRGDQVLFEELAADKIESTKLLNAKLIRMDENIKSALKASTIIIEFDSIKKINEFPKKIAFSIQFYTFPLIRTEASIIDESAGEVCQLKQAEAIKNWTNFVASSNDAMKIQFEVDPFGDDVEKSFKEFIEYLKENVCKIWIWNTETLIPIGVCKLPLIDLIRIEEPMRVIKKRCEIFFVGDDSNEIIGQLNLTLQNIGRKDSGGIQPKFESIIKESPIKKRGKVKVKSKPITAQELSSIPKTSEKTSLAYAYKEYSMHSHRTKPWELEGLFPDYEKYRMYSRSVVLAGMVDSKSQKGLEYTLGKIKVYPIQFTNKYHTDTSFNVLINDSGKRSEVTMIEDPKEWKQCCLKMGFEEPPDWGMAIDSKFLLKPYERVTLLFKVLALSPPITQNRLVSITIYNALTNGVELSDELVLFYYPCYYNASFLLNAPEARSIDTSFLLDSCLEKFANSKVVFCNDSNAEVTIDGNRLNLTVTTSSSAKDTELYIRTYADQYCLEHLCNILITLRPHTCIDINETAGKRVIQYLPLSSLLGRSNKQFNFYSSNPNLVRLDYAYSNPVTINENLPSVSLSVCSYTIGRSYILLHAIGSFLFHKSR